MTGSDIRCFRENRRDEYDKIGKEKELSYRLVIGERVRNQRCFLSLTGCYFEIRKNRTVFTKVFCETLVPGDINRCPMEKKRVVKNKFRKCYI